MHSLIVSIFLIIVFKASLARPSADNIIQTNTPRLTQQLQDKNMSLEDPILIRIFKKTKRHALLNKSGILEVWKQKNNRFILFKT